jgi:hypothetical protein
MFMTFILWVARFSSKRSNEMSKFAMLLLLDEFTYRNERVHFLKLVETLKVKNSTALFYAAMFSLEGKAEINSKAKVISGRMWQLNQRAIRTGESVADLVEKPDTPIEDLKGNRLDAYTDNEKHIEAGDKVAKMLIARAKIRRRIRGLLGL